MKILVFAGKKQSGKTTATNFVVGYTMTQLARQGKPYLPKKFRINYENGDLTVSNFKVNLDDDFKETSFLLDLQDTSPEFIRWANDCLYPYVKPYAYADLLKSVAIQVFGFSEEQLNGTDEQKNTPSHIAWKDMCALLPPRVVADKKKSGKYDK